MGKNKRGIGGKAGGGVFKVAGAKSLKKSKSKAVHLNLKNVTEALNQFYIKIKKKVEEVDAEFAALSKKSTPVPANNAPAVPKPRVNTAEKKEETKQQIADTTEKLVQMEC